MGKAVNYLATGSLSSPLSRGSAASAENGAHFGFRIADLKKAGSRQKTKDRGKIADFGLGI
jgi:hypothetical protein